MLQLINESFGLLLAFGMGIFAYPYMNNFTRILFFQLVTWLMIFTVSYILTTYQHHQRLNMSNQWLYNIEMLVEFSLLVLAIHYLFADKFVLYLSGSLYSLFLIVLFAQLKASGLSSFANYALAASGLTVTILYTLLLYRKFKTDPSSLKKSPEVIASIGLIIYFACNVPYFSLFNYLNVHYPDLSKKLFHMITDVLANVRYVCLAIAFWLVRKNGLAVNTNPIP
jgi:hypothetical protein